MSDPVKLLDEEVNAIKDFGVKYHTLTKRYGEVIFELRALDAERANVERAMIELDKSKSDLISGLQTKYGAGRIDLDAGTFTPDGA